MLANSVVYLSYIKIGAVIVQGVKASFDRDMTAFFSNCVQPEVLYLQLVGGGQQHVGLQSDLQIRDPCIKWLGRKLGFAFWYTVPNVPKLRVLQDLQLLFKELRAAMVKRAFAQIHPEY